MNYHYRCVNCNHEFEIRQSMMEPCLLNCPECKEDGLERVLYAAQVLTKGDPKTIGHQADRNTDNMGRYELQEKRQELKERGNKGRKQLPKPPWWRPNSTRPNYQLETLSAKEKEAYIYKGTSPSYDNRQQ